jgi:ATP-dependent helicase HepA
MNHLIQLATIEVARFLGGALPNLDPDWWARHVVGRLTFQQQRIAEERGFKSLDELDLAALLRVFDQNWYELSNEGKLAREGRSWLKELQTVRNKWAHLSSESIPPSETYRDADTLGLLLTMIGASQFAREAVEKEKAYAVSLMVEAKTSGSAGESQTKSAPPAVKDEEEDSSPFKIGDIVCLRSNPSVIFPVIEVVIGAGERRYRVFENNVKATYYESQLRKPPSERDERRILDGDELAAFISSLHILSASTASLFSMRSGRINFVPYQYRPVLKLIRSDRPRLLIADEVGVGKTIEAGLILKELRARMDLSSVLIICPRPLVTERKWFLEMKRFDETFTALDGRLLRHCMQETHLEGEWPDQYAQAIIPFSLFDSDLLYGREGRRGSKKRGLLSLDPPPKFDLVIVDEVHHIRNKETYLHQSVRFFCDNAEAVLFLSATPVQLGKDDLFTLLNVLRPDLVIDQASFAQMAAPNRHINAAVEACRSAAEGWQEEARASMEQVAETDWGRLFLRETPAFQGVYDLLGADAISDRERVGLTREIENLYTFGRMINRTRRRDIGEFTTRKPETLTIDFTPSQAELHDGLLEVVARILTACHGKQNVKFMMTTIRRQAASCLYGLAPLLDDILTGKLNQLEAMVAGDSEIEMEFDFIVEIREEISSLLVKARELEDEDPKAAAFVETVTEKSRLPNNRALVFSTFRHTLRYLSDKLTDTDLRFGVIHGDVPDDERSELRHRFRLDKEDPGALDVLLSSEVGCEGLDFQFCDFLVNYDLPWNPMRIEQRIGRIDRYGQQSEAVAIVNLITPGTVDADIYQRCLMRIGVFQHSIGGNEEILGSITRELHSIAESFNLTPEERNRQLQQLADNEIRRVREAEDLEARQASLFGLNVPKDSWETEVESSQDFWLSSESLQRCVSAYLGDRLEGDAEYLVGTKAAKNLRLNQSARASLLEDYRALPGAKDATSRQWEKWLRGDNPNLSVTFSQDAAADDSKVVHLSVTHPLVRQAALYWETKDSVFVSLSTMQADTPGGQYCFAVYRWRKRGVRDDEELVAVATHQRLETQLLGLLQEAEVAERELPGQKTFDDLDARHHEKWSAAQANHIAANREAVEHRIQSLNVSHKARRNAINDQITNATNDRIRLMRESELVRAEADFERRMQELRRASDSGDIHATPVIFGTITIKEDSP